MKENNNQDTALFFVYKSKVTNRKDPNHVTTFDKYHASYRGYNFELNLTDECRKTFEYEVKEFPINLLVSADDYFVKRKTFVRNDGTKGYKFIIVLKSYLSFTKAEFEKHSIDDIIDDLEEDKEGK